MREATATFVAAGDQRHDVLAGLVERVTFQSTKTGLSQHTRLRTKHLIGRQVQANLASSRRSFWATLDEMKTTLVFSSLLLCLSTLEVAGAGDRLPDGSIAESGTLRAWYASPTDRYPHGVLGDAIEAGTLVVEQDGVTYRYDLPLDAVFEDITPRLVDANGDGQFEILTIKSTLAAGAALALFGIRDDVLSLLAETPAIGTPNRWLNPAGVADYDGDGKPEIAAILTPHIGGVLVLYRWDGQSSEIIELRRRSGYSTHSIGSRDLDLALTVDWDGDGVMDLLLPRQNRTDLVAVHMINDTFAEGDTYRMQHEIWGNLEILGGLVRIPLRGGTDRTISRP